MDLSLFVIRFAPLLSIQDLQALRCVSKSYQSIVDELLQKTFFQSTLIHMVADPNNHLKLVTQKKDDKITGFEIYLKYGQARLCHKLDILNLKGIFNWKRVVAKIAPLATKTLFYAPGFYEKAFDEGRALACQILKSEGALRHMYLRDGRLADPIDDAQRQEALECFGSISDNQFSVFWMVHASFNDVNQTIDLIKKSDFVTQEKKRMAISYAIGAYAHWQEKNTDSLVHLIDVVLKSFTDDEEPRFFCRSTLIEHVIFPQFKDAWCALKEVEITQILNFFSDEFYGSDDDTENLLSELTLNLEEEKGKSLLEIWKICHQGILRQKSGGAPKNPATCFFS